MSAAATSMKVAILHDAVAPGAAKDLLDNLEQAEAIAGALRVLGHEPVLLPLSLNMEDTAARLTAASPDAAFNLVETVAGSSRLAHLAQGLLSFLGIPHTGAGETAMFAIAAKDRVKRELRTAGLPTPDWLELPLEVAPSLAAPLPQALREPGPWIVKPVWEHGSVGIDEDSLLAGGEPLATAREMNRRAAALKMACLAEHFVDGREFNMAVLEGPQGPEVLPAAEIVFRGYGDKPRVVGYRAKWEEESFEYANTVRAFPGEEDGALTAGLSRLALACFRLFGLSGYARVDFRVDGQGRPFIIDVNANPCLTPGAGFPETARHAGLSYPEMIGRILAVARA